MAVIVTGSLLLVPVVEATAAPVVHARHSVDGRRIESRQRRVQRSERATGRRSPRVRAVARRRQPTRTVAGHLSHIVRSGDTVASIAKRYGISANAVRAANGIIDDRLYLGAQVIIDGSLAPLGAPSSMSAGQIGPKLQRCPLRGASFMNDWGFPRDDGGRFHQGTDMFAPRGTTVVAPMSGTVVFGSNPLGGTTFNLTTDTGWVIYGAHLSSTIGASRRVSAGQPIARVGNSGDAAGGDTHLHVGLRRSGSNPINPYPSLRAACS
ncbi:MAG: peptidoglycan DD-metalloendopeptidase family protein [Actinobacteria bacterium]|nr:peptidoglycan DD-metalloendopeptidase family protein [Actinomycetota bacterium]